MNNWHKSNIDEVALAFGTDVVNGKANVKKDRKRRGDNNIFLLPSVDSRSVLKKLTADASLAMLIVVYVLTAFTGLYIESIVGSCLLFLVFCVSFSVKNASSKRIVNSYRLLLPDARIVENGERFRLSIFDVEVGDLIEFSQGDIIPADARIVSASNLIVAERYLDPETGKIAYRREIKSSEPLVDDMADSFANMLYAASMVVSGKGRGIVTETGSDTKFFGNKSGVRIVSDNDAPGYFSGFYKSTAKISLLAFFAVIPLTFLALIFKSIPAQNTSDFNLLYAFQLLLALSVTCMSELVVAPAESIVTKELLISSRKGRAAHNIESRITKLHSAESIADTDTVLILSPEILIDSEFRLRRIYFSDKRFRFDALKSDDLRFLFESIIHFTRVSERNLSKDIKAVKDFLKNNYSSSEFKQSSDRPFFLKDFPYVGARACVLKSDEKKNPISYIFYTDDPSVIEKCSQFRTEGGGLWKLDDTIVENCYKEHQAHTAAGLHDICVFSCDKTDSDGMIFEALLGSGREFPFADGNLAEEFVISGINPILFLENETSDNLNIAENCGLIDDCDDIIRASDYAENGLGITDAPISAKAYIGFSRKDISKLTKRFISNGRKILPVIKDSTDRRGVAPLTVYATHSTESYDSVKITSSMSLQAADSDSGRGGAYDTLKMIRGCSIARLKLGVYKNYLAYSMFLRFLAVCCSVFGGFSGSGLTSISILTVGFLFDAIAVISFMMSKGIPVKPKEAAFDAKVLFSPTLFLIFSVAGAITGISNFAITEILIKLGKLSVQQSSMFLVYSLAVSQIVALGAFLVILNKRTRRRSLNFTYLMFFLGITAFLFAQFYFPETVFTLLYGLRFYRLDFTLIPFVYLTSLLSMLIILLISKLLLLFSDSKNK